MPIGAVQAREQLLRRGSDRLGPLREILVLDWEIPYPDPRDGEDGVGDGGRDWRDAGLTETSQVRIRPDELDADPGRIDQVNHLMITEIAFDDPAASNRYFADHRGRKSEDDTALNLCGGCVGVDHIATVDGR